MLICSKHFHFRPGWNLTASIQSTVSLTSRLQLSVLRYLVRLQLFQATVLTSIKVFVPRIAWRVIPGSVMQLSVSFVINAWILSDWEKSYALNPICYLIVLVFLQALLYLSRNGLVLMIWWNALQQLVQLRILVVTPNTNWLAVPTACRFSSPIPGQYEEGRY